MEFVESLPIPAIFLFAVSVALVCGWLILFAVRWLVAISGFDPREALPMRDALISTTSAIFALTVAFSAAGIWSDTLQARAVVQREAHALQNVLALADGFPEALGARIRADVQEYAKRVVEIDWPAMNQKVNVQDAVFSRSDEILIKLIDTISLEQKGAPLLLATSLLSQLFEARSAGLARLTIASTGVSAAQWLALIALAFSALTAMALVHNHHAGVQRVTVSVYAFAAGAAMFVLLAHDRPFIGEISVSSKPLTELLANNPSQEPRRR